MTALLSPSTEGAVVDNPFKALRLATDPKLSQYELAARIGISKHALLRLEQGMFPEPLPRALNYFEDNFHLSRTELIQQYEAFQVQTRERHGKFLGPFKALEYWAPSLGHPLTWLKYRQHLNTTEVAKCLCISQTVVAYFEARPITQKSVPEQLLHALKDAGYDDSELDALKDAYRAYRVFVVENRRGI